MRGARSAMTYPDERIVPVSLGLTVLDLRVYRTAFLPALVALLVAAFALADRPAPARSSLPTDAVSGRRALATLDAMAQAFPSRPAGSRGDDGLAAYFAARLNTPLERRG